MKSLLVGLMLLAASPAWSQGDLNRLLDRASGVWAERKNGNVAKASTYADPSNRQDFPMYAGIKDSRLQSFELSNDPLKVVVITNVTMTPEPGKNVTQVVKETWAWSNGNWFLMPKAAEQPADSGVKSPAASKFEILDKKVDLGSHVQGETVTGSVKFKGPRFQVEAVRATGIPGLTVRGIDWADNTAGTIRFAIDTSLMSENMSKVAVFQPINSLYGLPDPVKPDSATISMQIKGKVRLVQLPQSDVAKREGMVELEIHNVGDTRFRIETVLVLNGQGITFNQEENILPALGPGESVILPVYLEEKNVSRDPELTFRFTPGVVPNNVLYFRLDLSNALPAPAAH